MFDENDIVRTTTVLTLLLTPGLLLYRMDIGLGVLLGGLMSVLALRLMVVDATRLLRMAKTVSLSSRDVSRLNRRSFLKRLALYAATFRGGSGEPSRQLPGSLRRIAPTKVSHLLPPAAGEDQAWKLKFCSTYIRSRSVSRSCSLGSLWPQSPSLASC